MRQRDADLKRHEAQVAQKDQELEEKQSELRMMRSKMSRKSTPELRKKAKDQRFEKTAELWYELLQLKVKEADELRGKLATPDQQSEEEGDADEK